MDGGDGILNGADYILFYANGPEVPKDINFQYGKGKMSLYPEDGTSDGNGYFAGFMVGGSASNTDNDKEGPEIGPFLNHAKFVNGGISNVNPLLILKLSDSSGINTIGMGIGHDIIATLDIDKDQFFVLNDFYQGELNSCRQRIVHFQLLELEPGANTLKIKALDIVNNSNEVILEFIVVKL